MSDGLPRIDLRLSLAREESPPLYDFLATMPKSRVARHTLLLQLLEKGLSARNGTAGANPASEPVFSKDALFRLIERGLAASTVPLSPAQELAPVTPRSEERLGAPRDASKLGVAPLAVVDVPASGADFDDEDLDTLFGSSSA